jgi:hypothetical protein
VNLYELGRLSFGRAAELAGMNRVEFLLELRRYKATPRRTPRPLSAAERRQREPPKPHEHLGALRDATPVEGGRVRSVRKAKALRRS